MLGLSTHEVPLGFRDHGGWAAVSSLRRSPSCWEFVINELHMVAVVHEDKQLPPFAGLENGQREGPPSAVVMGWVVSLKKIL